MCSLNPFIGSASLKLSLLLPTPSRGLDGVDLLPEICSARIESRQDVSGRTELSVFAVKISLQKRGFFPPIFL